MADYQEARVKLINTQWNKLKSAAKKKASAMLRLNQKTLRIKNCHMNCF